MAQEGLLVRKYSEVFVVEGNSAASYVQQLCDRQTQCVFAVQGKVPNADKKSHIVIMRSVQVQRLLEFLALEDSNDSRFRKIIILCDPDIDGQHASYLLANLLRQLRPGWVEQKLVYVAIAPLTGDPGEYTLPGSTERNDATRHQDVVRYHKGIASMDADLLVQHCIARETRRLKLLTPI